MNQSLVSLVSVNQFPRVQSPLGELLKVEFLNLRNLRTRPWIVLTSQGAATLQGFA